VAGTGRDGTTDALEGAEPVVAGTADVVTKGPLVDHRTNSQFIAFRSALPL
jgi:hypothetical protein